VDERETEIKLRVSRPDALKNRLRSLGATLWRRRHFEDNYILDFPDGKLRRKGLLLRVRMTAGRSTLTFKGPSRIASRTKSRRELETELMNGEETLKILGLLGLQVQFRYQKFRTEFRKGRTLLMLDETPIGTYLEIEGAAKAIGSLARKVGYKREDFITDTYFKIFRKCSVGNRFQGRNMIFDITS